MKNKIVGIGSILFVFAFVFILIGTNHDPNHFNDVTEIYIKIKNYSLSNSLTTKSLVISNQEVVKELVKPFKKFELVTKSSNPKPNQNAIYEIKMNNGYTLTFDSNWNNFDQTCHATFKENELEHCAPKEFFIQMTNIIKANT